MKLALSVPGYGNIEAPGDVPTGGLSTTGGDIIQTAITLLLVTAVVVALFMFIWSGIQWIMSKGEKEKVEAARNRIVFTVIGLAVVFLSFLVINVVGTFFGVELLKFNLDGSVAGGKDAKQQQISPTDGAKQQNRQNRQKTKKKNKGQKNTTNPI